MKTEKKVRFSKTVKVKRMPISLKEHAAEVKTTRDIIIDIPKIEQMQPKKENTVEKNGWIVLFFVGLFLIFLFCLFFQKYIYKK